MKRLAMKGYNGEAVFAGTKTETRRFLKFQGHPDGQMELFPEQLYLSLARRLPLKEGDLVGISEPYYAFGYWEPKEGQTKKSKPRMRFVDVTKQFHSKHRYLSNPPADKKIRSCRTGKKGWRLRIGMFMPDFAIRTVVSIQSVSVEPLGDITEAAAIREGVEALEGGGYRNYLDQGRVETAVESYQTMWEAINGEGSWNPKILVAVYRFERYKVGGAYLPGWKKVVELGDCTFEPGDTERENPLCPVCSQDYSDCLCPGPHQEDLYEYRNIGGVMYARKKVLVRK